MGSPRTAPAEFPRVWSWRVFGWGCAGGGLAYIMAFVLPELRKVAEEDEDQTIPLSRFGKRRVRAFIGLVFIYVVVAGFVAAVYGGPANNAKQSVAFGMSWEVVAKGLGTGVRGGVSGASKAERLALSNPVQSSRPAISSKVQT